MKRMVKIILVLAICVACFGCADGQYDGLHVKDGNGRILLLRHNVLDSYFITNLSEKPPTPNSKINEKL